jgi:hypothetical protein
MAFSSYTQVQQCSLCEQVRSLAVLLLLLLLPASVQSADV